MQRAFKRKKLCCSKKPYLAYHYPTIVSLLFNVSECNYLCRYWGNTSRLNSKINAFTTIKIDNVHGCLPLELCETH